MVLDTSVLLHIFFQEPGWESSVAFLMRQETRSLSAASLVEAQAVVAGRTTKDPIELLDVLVRDLGLEVAPLTATQAEIARRAYLRYGKGQGHPARLGQPSTSTTSSVRGPCTPSTRLSSMSDVAEGPEIIVSGRPARTASARRATPSGTVSTTRSAGTMQRW